MADKDVENGVESPTPASDRQSQDVEKTGVHEETKPTDPNVVDWDGPDDLDNPMNWPKSRRLACVVLASALTFVTPLASSIFAPGVPLFMKEFGSDNTTLASFVVSVYLLGFVLGPLFVAPVSEIIGRNPVYHAGNILFTIFSIACAVSTDLPMFCVFRLFQGMAGAVPLTNGGATIADVIPPEGRGSALAVWALGPLMGYVTIGPLCEGIC